MTLSFALAFFLGFTSACAMVLIALKVTTRRLKAQNDAATDQFKQEEARIEQMRFWSNRIKEATREAHSAYTRGDIDATQRALQQSQLANRRFWQEADKEI